MKPFNLEEALAGKEVVTRGKNKVTQLTVFTTYKAQQHLVGVVEEDVLMFNTEGLFGASSESLYDLFMEGEWHDNIPEKGVLCWAKEYPEDDPIIVVITRCQLDSSYPFWGGGRSYTHATPLTLEEIKEFTKKFDYESNK